MERQRQELTPITTAEIHERAVRLLTAQGCARHPAMRASTAVVYAQARMTNPETGSWYARRAFAELLGERLPVVIPDEERLAALVALRDRYVEIQEAKGFPPRNVEDGPFMGDDRVLYALEYMGNSGEATLAEVEVLRAQHCAEIMAQYTVE